jgi:hypothetical protein
MPSNNRPSDDELVAGLARGFGCPESVALSWLTSMFQHFDPRSAAEALVERETQARTRARARSVNDVLLPERPGTSF